MNPSSSIPDKMFFKIGEVSQLTGIKPYVLRYWESEFKLIRPQKNKTGQRVYRHQDVELIQRLKQLLYEERFTIEGAKKKIAQEVKQKKEQHTLTPPDKLAEILQQQEQELKSLITLLKK
jgi:DNA-binding transcriptional MerR regulator